MAATGAGVLQPSTPGVLASVGCVGLAGSSAGFAVAASIVSRVPPARGGGHLGPLHARGVVAPARSAGHAHPQQRGKRQARSAS
eukprot:6186492-Pleurochrysis_carterae.AAC.1